MLPFIWYQICSHTPRFDKNMTVYAKSQRKIDISYSFVQAAPLPPAPLPPPPLHLQFQTGITLLLYELWQ